MATSGNERKFFGLEFDELVALALGGFAAWKTRLLRNGVAGIVGGAAPAANTPAADPARKTEEYDEAIWLALVPFLSKELIGKLTAICNEMSYAELQTLRRAYSRLPDDGGEKRQFTDKDPRVVGFVALITALDDDPKKAVEQLRSMKILGDKSFVTKLREASDHWNPSDEQLISWTKWLKDQRGEPELPTLTDVIAPAETEATALVQVTRAQAARGMFRKLMLRIGVKFKRRELSANEAKKQLANAPKKRTWSELLADIFS